MQEEQVVEAQQHKPRRMQRKTRELIEAEKQRAYAEGVAAGESSAVGSLCIGAISGAVAASILWALIIAIV